MNEIRVVIANLVHKMKTEYENIFSGKFSESLSDFSRITKNVFDYNRIIDLYAHITPPSDRLTYDYLKTLRYILW